MSHDPNLSQINAHVLVHFATDIVAATDGEDIDDEDFARAIEDIRAIARCNAHDRREALTAIANVLTRLRADTAKFRL